MPRFKLTIEADSKSEILEFLNDKTVSTEIKEEKVESWDQSAKNAAIGFNETPVASASVETTQTNEIDVDSLGLPWDERIHSKPKKVNKDGSFKKKRGLDDTTFEAVKSELLGVQAPVTPVASTPVTPVASTPVTPVASTPVTPVASTPNTISSLMIRIQKAFTEGKINQDYLPELVTQVNGQLNTSYSSPAEFANDQNAIDTACNLMTNKGI